MFSITHMTHLTKPDVADFTVLFSNIRGVRSKMASLKSNINVIKPDVVCLNEHGITGRNKLVIDNFLSFTRNRQDKKMGGVSTSVHEEGSNSVLKVAEGTENDEFIITRHSQFSTPINIINVYGETESRCSEGEVKVVGTGF